MGHLHKPYMPVDEQIKLLEKRGMSFEGKKVAEILRREGYYSIINGYKDPFLEESNTLRKPTKNAESEDKYKDGVTFEQIYQLFLFDRALRLLIFGATTKAEAILRTTCSHCFTRNNPTEVNAYLNQNNYDDPKKVYGLVSDFNRILANNGPHAKHPERAKDYIAHCIKEHDGEVPLWVLSNDLTLGQMFWFFQEQTKRTRGAIAHEFTEIYNVSHKRHKEIDAKKLDSIYRRIKEFRNICAHDERLYCAHPHDKNATVFQLIKDLNLVLENRHIWNS